MRHGSKLLTTASLAALMAMPVVEITPANAQADTIIVTARKRAENIQDIPIAVTAYSGQQLQRLNISNVNDLSNFVPGFQFTNTAQRDFERPVIRGQANILGESGVSFFINGVYFDGSLSSIDLSEIERIEIVRGPQSALYGRNTYAGAINVITKKPGDEPEVNMKLEAASHDQYEATFGISGPVIEDIFSAGLYGRYYEYGGEHVNQFDGRTMGDEQSHSIAGTFVLTPTDNLEISGRIVYSEDDDSPGPNFLQPGSFNNVFGGAYFQGEVGPQLVNMNDVFQLGATNPDDIGYTQERIDGSLSINWNATDNLTVVSTTGYQDIDRTFKLDVDYIPTSFQTPSGAIFQVPLAGPISLSGVLQFDLTQDAIEEIEQFSQELRFEYDPGDRWNAMFGGYYYDQEEVNTNNRDTNAFNMAQNALAAANLAAVDTSNPLTNVSPCISPACIEVGRIPIGLGNTAINTTEITNWSIFGRFEIDATDWLTASFEGRYQEEKVKGTAFDRGDLTDPTDDTVTVTEDTFTAFLPRFTLTADISEAWDVGEASILYFNVSRGTKPGGLNVSPSIIAAGFPSFAEEKLWSYEVGSKNTFADGQIVANAAFFYNKLKGYQLTTNIEFMGMLDSATTNAGDATVKGVEFEASVSPNAIEGLTFTTNYSYIDSKFTSGTDANLGLLNDLGDNGLADGSFAGFEIDGIISLAGSIEGQTIPRSSMHQFFAGLDFTQPLDAVSEFAGTEVDWFAGVNVSYNSPRFSQVLNLAEFGEATLLNANIGIRTENWALTLWGKNLLDEDSPTEVVRYRDFNVSNPVQGGGASSIQRAYFGNLRRGRQIGGSVTANF